MLEVVYTTEPIPIEKLPIDVPGIGANLHSLLPQTFFPRLLSTKSERMFYDCLKTLVYNSQLLALEKVNVMLSLQNLEPDAFFLAGLIKLMNFDVAGALDALLSARPTNRSGGEYINKWLPQFRFMLRLNFTHLAVLYPNAFGREIAIAVCQWILRDHQAAIDTLNNCRRFISSSPESLLPLIEICIELGEVDKAYKLTRRDIPSFRDNLDFEIYAVEGRIQFLRGQFHESIRIFSSLIKARKGRNPWLITRVRYGLAMSQYKFGDLEAALKAIKELNPYYLPGQKMRLKVKGLIADWNDKLNLKDDEDVSGAPTNRALEFSESEPVQDEDKIIVTDVKQYYVTNTSPVVYPVKVLDPNYTSEMPADSGFAGFDLQGAREPQERFQTVGEQRAVLFEPAFWASLGLLMLFFIWFFMK